MNKISTYLAVSLMIVAGIVGVAIGYGLTPQYSLAMFDKTEMDLGRPDRWLDARYIDAMAAHHRGAMLLAEQAQQSQREEIRNLASDILKNEPKLIDELYQWKKDWYGDTRKARDPVVARLGSVDEKFDLRFLNALIAHHELGIEMTQDVRTKSSRTEVLNNADAVENFLKSTLPVLEDWRKQWYNI